MYFTAILFPFNNKRIVYILERSERTIEVHRSRIMRKLGVDNVVDLDRRATAMGLGN
jgi:DNA-binding NarL/FixJ family response regulator